MKEVGQMPGRKMGFTPTGKNRVLEPGGEIMNPGARRNPDADLHGRYAHHLVRVQLKRGRRRHD